VVCEHLQALDFVLGVHDSNQTFELAPQFDTMGAIVWLGNVTSYGKPITLLNGITIISTCTL
jgi:hypothetical protein